MQKENLKKIKFNIHFYFPKTEQQTVELYCITKMIHFAHLGILFIYDPN